MRRKTLTPRNPEFPPTGWTGKPLGEIARALKAGDVSAEDLVTAYFARIELIDRAGPTLQSVLTVNPDVLDEARRLDTKRMAGEPLGALHGLPLLIKDNIETRDAMATTAGALALKDNLTGRDAPLVKGLRAAGAIILGKTNLSQWANFRAQNSISGWSALGGQVRNPHMLDRTPCGSSSGSGAAVAASLAAGAIGTETNGSIICPANVNGIVGFKPTVGLVSQQHIIPISSSQDTAGPMTRTVEDAAMLLSAMATGPKAKDFVSGLSLTALEGTRVGVLRFAQGPNRNIISRFDTSLAILEEAGAILIEIDDPGPRVRGLERLAVDLLKFEFHHTLDAYLADTPQAVTVRSLDDLIAFNKMHADIELALFGQDTLEAAAKLPGLDDPRYLKARETVQSATRANGIDALLSKHDVSVLVAPSGAIAPRTDPVNGDVWPEGPGAAGFMAAVAGYPHLTVPMGTVHSIPVGLSFVGAKDRDAAVLSMGYAWEQRSGLRAEPQYLPDAEAIAGIEASMRRETTKGQSDYPDRP
jgi:amidase